MPAKKRVIAPESLELPSTRGGADDPPATSSSASRAEAKSTDKHAPSAKPSAAKTGTSTSGAKQVSAGKDGAAAKSATPKAPPAKAATTKGADAKSGVAKSGVAKSGVAKRGVASSEAPVRTPTTPNRAARLEADVSAVSIPVTVDGAQGPAPSPTDALAASVPRRLTIPAATIRQHAYFLSLQRRGSGDPVADWLDAERDLRARGG